MAKPTTTYGKRKRGQAMRREVMATLKGLASAFSTNAALGAGMRDSEAETNRAISMLRGRTRAIEALISRNRGGAASLAHHGVMPADRSAAAKKAAITKGQTLRGK